MGVRRPVCRIGLSTKALPKDLIFREMRMQNLEGIGPPFPEVQRSVDIGHAPPAEEFEDSIPATDDATRAHRTDLPPTPTTRQATQLARTNADEG